MRAPPLWPIRELDATSIDRRKPLQKQVARSSTHPLGSEPVWLLRAQISLSLQSGGGSLLPSRMTCAQERSGMGQGRRLSWGPSGPGPGHRRAVSSGCHRVPAASQRFCHGRGPGRQPHPPVHLRQDHAFPLLLAGVIKRRAPRTISSSSFADAGSTGVVTVATAAGYRCG